MGLEDRDWWREPRAQPRRWPGIVLLLLIVTAIGAVVHVKGLPRTWKSGGEARLTFESGFGLGSSKPSYAPGDRWTDYLAPENVCPGGENLRATPTKQVETMLCLIDFARSRAGLRTLPANPILARAAELKGQDMVRCRDFNHNACGRDPHAVADEAGYASVSWGENLFISTGPNGAPRPALDGWLNSEGHRENLLNPVWTEQGVALLTAPRFEGHGDAALWVSEFGAR